jgi:sugar phosphate isomerase/epimerase
MTTQNNFPKLHNAMWPGLVGKGSPGAEPFLDLDTMLELTAKAEVDGVKFDGVDLFLSAPHTAIDSGESDLQRLAEKLRARKLVAGTLVAPVWPATGGGSAMGGLEERKKFIAQVRSACRIGARLREIGVRPYDLVRIDSAASVAEWAKNPKGNTKRIAATFREAAAIAADHGERLAAEGEICWGGMHGWKDMLNLLERVDRPKIVGFQADMSHTLLYLLGANAPRERLVPKQFHWEPGVFHAAMTKLTDALRPWTMDFHVAQNDGTVFGSGSHEKTGRHCLATDPRGKLNVPRDAGYWLRSAGGKVTRKCRHLCWDGCMFPNQTMLNQQTWNDVLTAMIEVRNNHGWSA